MSDHEVWVTKVQNGYVIVDRNFWAVTTVHNSFEEVVEKLRSLFDEKLEETPKA